MAKSRLHIICGNCGCNHQLSFCIEPKGNCNYEGVEYPAVYITCGNCATLHNLSNFLTEKPAAEPSREVVSVPIECAEMAAHYMKAYAQVLVSELGQQAISEVTMLDDMRIRIEAAIQTRRSASE